MVVNSTEVLKSLVDPGGTAVKQQHGVDLTIYRIAKVRESPDVGVWKSKTIPAHEFEKMPDAVRMLTAIGHPIGDMALHPVDGEDTQAWYLEEGVYSIYFDQGIEVPANCKANIIHRSSIARCGGQIYSGEYDPGFKATHMGAFLVVHSPFYIEKGARVAQIVMQRIEGEVEQYNGQWMGKH